MSKKTKELTPIKLDFSFGELPQGHPFTRPYAFEPLRYPWPIKDNSVEEAYSAYLLNRVPGNERGRLMDALWHALAPGAKATVIVPYWTSARSVQDPMSEWPPLVEQSFLYFNKKFREDNKLGLPWKCDFDFVYGYSLEQETQLKTDDARPFWIKHYANAVNDLQVVLTKRP